MDTFPESIPIIELPSSDFHYPSAAVRITGSSFDIVTVQSKLGSLDLTRRGIFVTPSSAFIDTSAVIKNTLDLNIVTVKNGITSIESTHASTIDPNIGLMNEKKCDEEIFQDHRDQELAAAATQTKQIQNTGLLYAPHGLRLSPAQKFKNIIHSSKRSVFTFHGDAVRVTTNPWRHRQSRGEKCI